MINEITKSTTKRKTTTTKYTEQVVMKNLRISHYKRSYFKISLRDKPITGK